MKEITKAINLVVLVCVTAFIAWAVTPRRNVCVEKKAKKEELKLFEMSIEQLMEVEVASNSKEKTKLSKPAFPK